MAGQFLVDIQGMSDREIVLEFNRRGYLDFDLTKGTLFRPELVANNPVSLTNAENKSIPDQATDYLHKFIKWQQTSVRTRCMRQPRLPFQMRYRTELLMIYPCQTLPYTLGNTKPLDKLYTKMADTLFKLEKGFN